MIESETEPDDSRREVLVRLYDQLINRDTVLIQTIFIVVGAGVTAIPLLLVNVHPYVAGHGSGYVHHAWDYLALPLIPTVVGGLLGFLTLHVQFVAQYGHAIEERLCELTNDHLSETHLKLPGFKVQSPAYLRLSSKLFGSGRKRATLAYRAATLVTLVAVAAVVIAIPAIILASLPLKVNLVIVTIYVPLNLLTLTVILRSLAPNRALLRDTLLEVAQESGQVSSVERSERRLTSYLAVPRLADHMAKMLIGLIGASLGSLALFRLDRHEFAFSHLWIALALYVGIFEYLFYQARYSVNDMRGASDDLEHKHRKSRGRIPGPINLRTLLLVLASISFKFALGLFLLLIVAPPWSRAPLLLGLGGMALSAIVYEIAREFESKGEVKTQGRINLPEIGVFLTVGVGYAIRAIVGFTLADRGVVNWIFLLILAISFWAFDTSTVCMAWVFEGVQNLEFNDLKLPTGNYFALLRSKPHLATLLRQAGLLSSGSLEVAPNDVNTTGDKDEEQSPSAQYRALAGQRGWVFSNWTVFGAFAFVATCLMGLFIANGFATPEGSSITWVTLVATVGALAWCRPKWTLLGMLVGLLGIVILGTRISIPFMLLALGVVAGLSTFYDSTRRSNYVLINYWLRTMRVAIGRACKVAGLRILSLVFGKPLGDAWQRWKNLRTNSESTGDQFVTYDRDR